MQVPVKICGITQTDEMELLRQTGMSYAGLWYDMPNGAHSCSLDQLIELSSCAGDSLEPVLVTVSQNLSVLSQALEQSRISAIQFHGFQLPAFIQKFRATVGKPLTLFKVLHVKNNQCLEDGFVERYMDAGVDRLILDSYQDSHRIGSTGQAISDEFVEQFIERYQVRDKVMLAGGINAYNIRGKLEQHRPFGFDIDSAARTQGRICRDQLKAITTALQTVQHPATPKHLANIVAD